MNKRIIGLDFARGWAILGMIIVNFKIVLGAEGNASLKILCGVSAVSFFFNFNSFL